MITDLRSVQALQKLRMEYQESAGMDFPAGCLTELLILYDICKSLDLSLFQVQQVLGAPGWALVIHHINSPAGVPTKLGLQLAETL